MPYRSLRKAASFKAGWPPSNSADSTQQVAVRLASTLLSWHNPAGSDYFSMLASLTREDFAPHVGSIFVVHFGDGGFYSLTLDTVKGCPLERRPAGYRDPFSLFFSGPGPEYLMQDRYQLNHEAMGELEIFLVPIGERGDRFVYQASFN